MLLATSYISMPQLVIQCIYVHSLTHSLTQLLELLTQIICVFLSVMIFANETSTSVQLSSASSRS